MKIEKVTNNIDIDIIIPFYNPEIGWEQTVSDKILILQKNLPNITINTILVNDGSNENLSKAIEFIKTTIPNVTFLDNVKNQGKGFSLRKGFSLGSSQYSLFTDVDFPYEISSILFLINGIIDQKADVIIGKRTENYYQKLNKQRRFISKLLQLFNKTFLRIEEIDSQAGLKAFNNKGKEEFLKTNSNRFLADLEFVIYASKKNLNMTSLFVKLRTDIKLPKMNILSLVKEIPSLIRILLT